MKIFILCFAAILAQGCVSLYQSRIVKTETGVVCKMNKPGEVTYKDKDIEASFNTQTPSILRTLVEGATVRILSQGVKE